MKVNFLKNGNLEMSLDKFDEVRKALRPAVLDTIDAEQYFIRTFLKPLGYESIPPESIGALTAAPLITDGENVWGFMGYQITAFLEALMAGETIVWQKG